MKAILVIDMPKNCGLCPISNNWLENGEQKGFCPVKNDGCNFIERPSSCPLKSMPQKMDEFDEDPYRITWFKHGFNTFLEVISKDENI